MLLKYLLYSLLGLFVLISTAIYSQKNYQDVVYLKNGSVIRGIITEQIPNKYIKIETVGDNIFVFQVDEIEKLTKEESRALHNVSKNSFLC